jgi:hypothetical protein
VLAKGIKQIAYEIIFLSAEIYIFRVANKTLSKRCRAKKTRVCQGDAFIIEDAQDIIAQKDMDKQVQHNIYAAGGSQREGQPSRRRYRTCGKASYNTRACQEDIDISSASDSI